MNFEDFKILCQQSTMVNNTMAQFIDKLSKIRKDPIDPFAFWWKKDKQATKILK